MSCQCCRAFVDRRLSVWHPSEVPVRIAPVRTTLQPLVRCPLGGARCAAAIASATHRRSAAGSACSGTPCKPTCAAHGEATPNGGCCNPRSAIRTTLPRMCESVPCVGGHLILHSRGRRFESTSRASMIALEMQLHLGVAAPPVRHGSSERRDLGSCYRFSIVGHSVEYHDLSVI